jgi:fructose-bisphosphate aldolase class II
VEKALELGFTSVMFDSSLYPFEENISRTKQVVEIAGRRGAMVEAELGLVGGSEDGKAGHGIRCTDPADAEVFCRETDVDALAVAIGNAHGNYPTAPKLAFDVLEEIHRRVNIPLVLHGGSGITDEDFRKAISLGIVKVNIATASFDRLTLRAEEYLRTDGAHNYFELNEAMVQGTYENVKHHIQVFNCKKPLDEI